MRTTLNIDEPVLLAVKSLAAQTGKTIGETVSELLVKALTRDETPTVRNGVPVFPRSSNPGPATMELVNELRDADAE